MEASDRSRAVRAATSIAEELQLTVHSATVLQNSNKLSLRLRPCDTFARVAPVGHEVAELEVAIAQQLAEAQSPVAALDPRVEPRVYGRDGFVVTLWTFYEPVADGFMSPGDYASALERLHAGMRGVDVATPHFTDRIEEAQQLVANPELTPAVSTENREFLSDTFRHLRQTINDRDADEQLLHGEPHPGNVVATTDGPRFVDLETCCRGPIAFDLAHVPNEVAEHYPNVDRGLLHDCQQLVLAMVLAWRWDRHDQFPNREQAARQLLAALRGGPPWPTLDALMGE